MNERGQPRPMSHATDDNLYETFARDDGGILKTSSCMCSVYVWAERMHACMHATPEKKKKQEARSKKRRRFIKAALIGRCYILYAVMCMQREACFGSVEWEGECVPRSWIDEQGETDK